MARCAVCGDKHAACGPPTTVIPVDERFTRRDPDVGALKKYEVTVDGRHPHKTTLKLSDAEAERMGLLKKEPTAKEPPAAKADQPPNKAAAPQENKQRRFGRSK